MAKKVAWLRPKDFLEKYVHKHDKPKDGEDERMQLIADGIMPGDVTFDFYIKKIISDCTVCLKRVILKIYLYSKDVTSFFDDRRS